MLFSIIIPTFNRARLIGRAIDSVLAQDFPDWEMIVIDDGSTDSTGDMIRHYSDSDPRIQYHYTDNQGASAARNFGCSMASGKYFTFLDSDDEYLPGHLSLRSEMISAQPAIEFLHGTAEIIGDEMVVDCNDPSKLIPLSDCVIGGTFFIRRDLFGRLGGFAYIPYAHDTELFERASEMGALIKKIGMPTYRYYRNEADSLCAVFMKEGIPGIEKLRSHAERI
jgi:glycosyltransferase involved in cell wall biosynthesis